MRDNDLKVAMNIRDLFAAAALVGLTTPGSEPIEQASEIGMEEAARRIASSAFIIATAMMNERATHVPAAVHSESMLQTICMEWNGTHPIGTEVEYHPVIGEAAHRLTRTRTAAYVLSCHTAVIFVEGVAGCVALESLTVVPSVKG